MTALLKEPVEKILIKLSSPMILGIFSTVFFNLVDTYFIAQIGTKELAAISFTFPVVMILANIAMGIGTGTAAVIAKSVGAKHSKHSIFKLSISSLLLSFTAAIIFSILGFFSMPWIFINLFGADLDIFKLIQDYMNVWYGGIVFLLLSWNGNSVLRGTGDTKTPSYIMVGAAIMNCILDPIFIFGVAGIEGMGISGAAWATVITRLVSVIVVFIFLYKNQLFNLTSNFNIKDLLAAWKKITFIAIPAISSNVMLPISTAIILNLLASYGEETVAAFVTGARLRGFFLIPIFALSGALISFVGQNFGAQNFKRIQKAMRFSFIFAIGWGILACLLSCIFKHQFAKIFSQDINLLSYLSLYIMVLSFSYAFIGIFSIAESYLNAMNKPIWASSLMLIRLFILYLPLVYLGSLYFGFNGIIYGATLGNVLAGIVSVIIFIFVAKQR